MKIVACAQQIQVFLFGNFWLFFFFFFSIFDPQFLESTDSETTENTFRKYRGLTVFIYS